ncbi:serine hydrolase [Streptomyces litchfieldiae]|uniref:Serine hydrolase n=1 Tax=Streptomyces litchfieldiae TaxID=3075543 RepID=A0ABU2N1U2_9ACTN|nr:serine hydrolase [Streptomyces sp. DSM 44938]MDT0347033.1 serine hydrolase [Streptomyces sp. DSM 44938]
MTAEEADEKAGRDEGNEAAAGTAETAGEDATGAGEEPETAGEDAAGTAEAHGATEPERAGANAGTEPEGAGEEPETAGEDAAGTAEAHGATEPETAEEEPGEGISAAAEPEAGQPEAGEPKTTVLRVPETADGQASPDDADLGQPAPAEAEAGTPDAAKPDAGDRKTTVLRVPDGEDGENSGEPEAGERDAKKPEAGRPGTAEPKTTVLRVPETGDGEEPGDDQDSGTPETAKPDAGRPGTAEPKTTVLRDPDAGDDEKSPDEPGAVDQKTAVLRLPEGSTGAVDQKTTTLRVPDQPKEPAKPAEPPAEPPAQSTGVLPLPAPAPPAGPPPVPDSQRDPLDLLAELTNKPAPPPTPLRTALRRIKIWTPLVVLLLIVLVVVQSLRPLPEPELELTAAETFTFEGESPTAPWPDSGQAAMDVEGLGTFGSSGEQEPVPIASVAKVMTAYVIMRDHPMAEDTDGTEIPVDQQAEDDAALEEEGESTVEVEAGTSITQREAMQAIMIASANNVARLLARWDAGSEEEFVDKMNEAAAELGMEDTTYTDPSGLNDDTVSTARDQTILAKAVMDDPVFRQVVRMPSYVDSAGATHYNWNGLVPVNNVIGIKTGTTSAAGGCLMFAAIQEVDGTEQLIVGAVLGQPPRPSDNSILGQALDVGDGLIRFAQGELTDAPVLSAGDVVGEVDDGLGGTTPVVVTEDVRAVGWAGLDVRLVLTAGEGGVPSSAEAGTEVGSLVLGSGPAEVRVPVALGADLSEPGFSSRLVRLA